MNIVGIGKKYLRRISRLPLIVESAIWLLVAHSLRKLIPIPRLFSILGMTPTTLLTCHHDVVANASSLPKNQLPTRYLDRVARFLRFDKRCLTTAIGMRIMLGIRRYQTEIIFGVAYDSNKALIAHAWSTYDGKVITGGETDHVFTPVSRFICAPIFK